MAQLVSGRYTVNICPIDIATLFKQSGVSYTQCEARQGDALKAYFIHNWRETFITDKHVFPTEKIFTKRS